MNHHILRNFSRLFVIVSNFRQNSAKYLLSNYCTKNSESITTQVEIETAWTPIYKLPLVRWVAAFNRLKVYQAIVTSAGFPAIFALEQAGIADSGSATVFAVVGLTGCATLTLGSLVSKNLIAFVYINDTADKVKLAYVDFWGRRKNVELFVDEIIPASEILTNKYQIFQKVTTGESHDQKYKLLHRFAKVLHGEHFAAIFGEGL